MTKKDWKEWQELIEETVPKLEELQQLQADADSYDELSEKQQQTPKGELLLEIQELDLERAIDALNGIESSIHALFEGE